MKNDHVGGHNNLQQRVHPSSFTSSVSVQIYTRSHHLFAFIHTQKCLRSCCFSPSHQHFLFLSFCFVFISNSNTGFSLVEVIVKTKKKKRITVNSLQRHGSIYKHGEMLFKISDLTDYRYKLFTAGNEWRNMLCLHGWTKGTHASAQSLEWHGKK